LNSTHPPILAHLSRELSTVTLSVTDHCNLNCRYCFNDATRPGTAEGKYLSVDDVRQIAAWVHRLAPARKVSWVFTGGEPMLHPASYYYGALEAIRQESAGSVPSQGQTFAMQTNGTLLDDGYIRLLRFYRHELQLGISLDGPPAINDLYRGRGRDVVRNMRRLRENGLRYGALMVLTRENCQRITEVLDFFRREVSRDLGTNLLVPVGPRGGRNTLPDSEDLAAAYLEMLRHIADGRLSYVREPLIYLFHFFSDRSLTLHCKARQCGAGRLLLSIDHNGDIELCHCTSHDTRWVIGNVFDGVDWDTAQKKYDRFHTPPKFFARCADCQARRICCFACPGDYHENILAAEVDCAVTRTLYDHFAANPDHWKRVYNRVKLTVLLNSRSTRREA